MKRWQVLLICLVVFWVGLGMYADVISHFHLVAPDAGWVTMTLAFMFWAVMFGNAIPFIISLGALMYIASDLLETEK